MKRRTFLGSLAALVGLPAVAKAEPPKPDDWWEQLKASWDANGMALNEWRAKNNEQTAPNPYKGEKVDLVKYYMKRKTETLVMPDGIKFEVAYSQPCVEVHRGDKVDRGNWNREYGCWVIAYETEPRNGYRSYRCVMTESIREING